MVDKSLQGGLKKFAKDTGWAFISLAVAALTQFILRIFLARYYGASDLGLYTLAFTAYSFGLVFSAFGLDSGLVKFTAEWKETNRDISLLLTIGGATSLFFGCIMGLILYVASPYLSHYFFKMPELTPLLRIVSFAFPFIALEKATLGYLNGIRRMRLYALINIFQAILTIGLTITFALLRYDIKYAVWGLILPIVLMSLIALFIIRKSLFRPNIIECYPYIKMLLGFGFFVILASSMGTIQTYTDTTLLGHYMTNIDVGIYSVAAVFYQAIVLPPGAIQTITAPMIAGYWGKREIGKIEYLINKSMKYTSFYAIIAAFIVVFLSRNLIILFFGGGFVSAAVPLQILAVGAVLPAIGTSIGSSLSGTAFVKVIFVLSGITALLNIILNVLLIPFWGITGAAVATSTSMTVSSIIQLYFIHRLIGINIDWIWFVKIFGTALLIAGVTYGIVTIFNVYAGIILGLLILIIVLWRYFTTSEDRKLIIQGIHLRKQE